MLPKGKVTEYLKFVFRTKGFIGFFLRIGMLVRRFDLSGNKMKQAVSKIQQIGKKYSYQPALIIPAVVLKRYYSFFNRNHSQEFLKNFQNVKIGNLRFFRHHVKNGVWKTKTLLSNN